MDYFGPNISHYQNGSLYGQLNDTKNLSSPGSWNAYSSFAPNTNPDINLTFLPGHILELTFAVGNGNLSKTLPVVFMLLNPNATQVDVICSYPLSGAYDRLPRFLFYGTLIVALLFRRNGIIAMAAISVAMTYSALAAIHMFVLMAWYRWGSPADVLWDKYSAVAWGDIDYMGILPVLTATTVMLTPILTWSSTIRTNEARVVMVYWSLLIFGATIPTIYLWINWSHWDFDILPSAAYCTGTGTGCSWLELESNMNEQSYSNCKCVDFCGLLSPTAPLRKGTNMVPVIGLKAAQGLVNNGVTAIEKTYELIYVVWIVALAQGVLSLLSIQSSPTQVRNGIFRFLNADRATILGCFLKGERGQRMLRRLHIQDGAATARLRNTIFTNTQRFIAKLSAAIYLIITITGMIIYPATLIATIVVNELNVGQYPTSEHSDALGAWSPYVAAGLVILVSLILKFHAPISRKLKDLLSKPFQYIAYSKNDRPRSDLPKRKRIKLASSSFLESFTTLVEHISFLIRYRKWHIFTQVKLFREWWRDPETVSDSVRWATALNADLGTKPDWDEVSKYRWEREGQREPKCWCRKCSSESGFRHVRHGSDDLTAGYGNDSDEVYLLQEVKQAVARERGVDTG